MKITDLKVYLTRPKSSTRSWLFVEIDTDEGITGTGESTNSGGGGALVLAHTYNMMKNDLEGQDFSEGLIGENPSNIAQSVTSIISCLEINLIEKLSFIKGDVNFCSHLRRGNFRYTKLFF